MFFYPEILIFCETMDHSFDYIFVRNTSTSQVIGNTLICFISKTYFFCIVLNIYKDSKLWSRNGYGIAITILWYACTKVRGLYSLSGSSLFSMSCQVSANKGSYPTSESSGLS